MMEMNDKGTIRAVCISPAKGTEKSNIHTAVLKENWGIEGDAHAGTWHRQISLLSWQKVQEFNLLGACVSEGAFGENLLVAHRNKTALRGRIAGGDTDRQRMPPWVRHSATGWNMYHAA